MNVLSFKFLLLTSAVNRYEIDAPSQYLSKITRSGNRFDALSGNTASSPHELYPPTVYHSMINLNHEADLVPRRRWFNESTGGDLKKLELEADDYDSNLDAWKVRIKQVYEKEDLPRIYQAYVNEVWEAELKEDEFWAGVSQGIQEDIVLANAGEDKEDAVEAQFYKAVDEINIEDAIKNVPQDVIDGAMAEFAERKANLSKEEVDAIKAETGRMKAEAIRFKADMEEMHYKIEDVKDSIAEFEGSNSEEEAKAKIDEYKSSEEGREAIESAQESVEEQVAAALANFYARPVVLRATARRSERSETSADNDSALSGLMISPLALLSFLMLF